MGNESYSDEEVKDYAESGIDYYPDGEIEMPSGIELGWDAIYNVRTDDYEKYPIYSLKSSLDAFGIDDVVEHVNECWEFERIDYYEVLGVDAEGITTVLVDIDVV